MGSRTLDHQTMVTFDSWKHSGVLHFPLSDCNIDLSQLDSLEEREQIEGTMNAP
jgi:hypothetical protein